jgi:hypothetical protein
VVVTTGIAGIVMVTLPVFVLSAIDVAVMVIVCCELVAAGAVKVAEDVVVFDSVPPPLTLQFTPAAFLSFVTVTLTVVVFAPSTVGEAAVTEMLSGAELPPMQPPRHKDTSRPMHAKMQFFLDILRTPGEGTIQVTEAARLIAREN